MYTLFSALGVTALAILLPLAFGLEAKWTALPAIILGIVAFIWMGRRVARRVEQVTQASERELAALQQAAQKPGPRTQAVIAQKLENAIQILQRGFAFEKWQFGVGTMLNARIGMLLFSRPQVVPTTKVTDAIPYLERARVRGKKAKLLSALWPAWAMLGVAYWKKGDTDRARKVFDESLAVVRKESLLWSLYAWLLADDKKLDEAIEVLARGKEALPDDARLTENLTALQNRKKLNMRAYGESWYQFGLETPKMAGMAPKMPHPRSRAGGLRRR